ncbi:SMI1/KNR4 family protein [Flavobacterium sp. PL02]|uniref:SMI1/KNR4 family protein n=1 Tax=Flavobacterium sp. PL02 TaxID=3088354 RepID=UPI002B22E2E1|nr:SMI1/KNR4 family protein [Flavobacterium sp. PL02]MEA9412223.1 SMI1/KNR4 family protein [Flavobacterium sp. PL02]
MNEGIKIKMEESNSNFIAEQIERIKSKLVEAKQIDKDLKVFGASSHKYILGEVVNAEDILKFETEYNVELPNCYKAFLMNIGNGGESFSSSAAGPFYGIYPLGKNVNDLIYENTKEYLKGDCILYPKMSDEYWDDSIEKIEEDAISDDDYEKELGKIYGGILPIGEQGCSCYHAIVLNGDFKGRVVNINSERYNPQFTFELNFLDWYERWLDEVISGDLMQYNAGWFGYRIGGSLQDILKMYFLTNDDEVKSDCLIGILIKQKLDAETLDIIEEEYKISKGENQKELLQILAKFDYERAYPYLVDFTDVSLLHVFQFVFWYAKDKSSDWLGVIESNMEMIKDDETFSFCAYLLKEMNIDYSYLIIPFTESDNESIKVTTYYMLGQLSNKNNYIDAFIVGLNDKSNRVVHTALQALNGVEDKKLLKHYKNIAERFPVEQDYILVNLNLRLKPLGLSNTTIKDLVLDA